MQQSYSLIYSTTTGSWSRTLLLPGNNPHPPTFPHLCATLPSNLLNLGESSVCEAEKKRKSQKNHHKGCFAFLIKKLTCEYICILLSCRLNHAYIIRVQQRGAHTHARTHTYSENTFSLSVCILVEKISLWFFDIRIEAASL